MRKSKTTNLNEEISNIEDENKETENKELEKIFSRMYEEASSKGMIFAQISYKKGSPILAAFENEMIFSHIENQVGIGAKIVKTDALKNIKEVPLVESMQDILNIEQCEKVNIEKQLEKSKKEKEAKREARAQAKKEKALEKTNGEET